MAELFLVATPIGNLEDITLRALRTLKEVDFIAAEDTRRTVKLLNFYQIKKPLTSFHEHSGYNKAIEIIGRIQNGESCALVSDAGMPLISDPGAGLVSLCIKNNIKFTIIPGASAGITALCLSGLDAAKFSFYGFLAQNKKEQRFELEQIKNELKTMIFYEAPHRVKQTLKTLFEALGSRNASAARELTKIHEEVIRGSLDELCVHFENNEPRGEFVIIIEGRSLEELSAEKAEKWNNISVTEHVKMLEAGGISENEAIKTVAKERGLNKREVYSEVKIK